MSNDYAAEAVQIDELNLDKECIRLPSDYLKFARLAADAKRNVDELKDHVEVVEADLARDIRDHPAKYGMEKETEKAVAAAVLVQTTYQSAAKRLNQARYEAELAQAVVWALEHKKRSLTLLVELHGLGYSANPKLSKHGREAVEEMTKHRARKYYHKED